MVRYRRAALIALVAMVLIVSVFDAQAQSSTSKEYQVKAAFLFNFAKFVEWPSGAFKDSSSPLVFGILGRDPFGDAIDPLRDKMIEGRRVEIRRFLRIQDLQKCHVLFVSSSEASQLPQILNAVRGWNTLTVGDNKSFAQSGGMINLLIIEDRVGFEVNLAAAEKGSLKISSKLLRLGKVVQGQ